MHLSEPPLRGGEKNKTQQNRRRRRSDEVKSYGNCGGKGELEEPPASFKSAVWEHFGFPVEYNGGGVRVVDRAKTVCVLTDSNAASRLQLKFKIFSKAYQIQCFKDWKPRLKKKQKSTSPSCHCHGKQVGAHAFVSSGVAAALNYGWGNRSDGVRRPHRVASTRDNARR